MSNPLTIEITSDFVCPWCLIGEERLNKALAQTGIKADIKWRPFELNRDLPAEGMDRRDRMVAKFGSAERVKAMEQRLIDVGAEDGINFRYDLIERSPNTRKAHRLAWWAAQQGDTGKLARRLFEAYFLEGKDIGDVNVLASLTGEAGLDADKARAFLASNEGVEEITKLEQEAMDADISSVPTFRIGDEIVEGAIPVEDMIEVLQRAAGTARAA